MYDLSISEFAIKATGQPLYPYQELIANAILDSIKQGKGLTFTVMLARQMGKNQLSAILEAYLLINQAAYSQSGTIIKAAPTFRPQIFNSRMRLQSMLANPHLDQDIRKRVWHSEGYIIGVALPGSSPREQAGPRVMFFSAGPGANIVGATASLLLEIDEAQNVGIDKFDRDLRPMASTTNATTVLYGTAWSDDTLLAIMKANNQELEEQDGIRRHFEFDWTALAAINSNYKRYVESEIQRLGEDHLTIRTQYRLLPISGAGFLLNEMQRYLLKGTHDWLDGPEDDEGSDGVYIAGMDVAGEDRPQQGEVYKKSSRDSTVITIGRATYNELGLPRIDIVHQVWWTGKAYDEQYAQAEALCRRWGVKKIVVDRTGLGEGMASLLERKLGRERVISFRFSRPSKSSLTYQFLSMVEGNRIKMYRQDEAPDTIYEECWKQLTLARYRVPGPDLLDMYVQPGEGHDDFLMSVALACEAVREWSSPISEASIVKPRRLYGDEGRY